MATRRIITEFILLCFSALFLYSGVSKLLNFYVFSEQLALYPLLKPLSEIISLLLPIIEIMIAVSLLFRKLRSTALYASFILMLVFTEFITYILLVDETLPCTCGGLLEAMSWTQHLVFNVTAALLALTGIGMIRWENRINGDSSQMKTQST